MRETMAIGGRFTDDFSQSEGEELARQSDNCALSERKRILISSRRTLSKNECERLTCRRTRIFFNAPPEEFSQSDGEGVVEQTHRRRLLDSPAECAPFRFRTAPEEFSQSEGELDRLEGRSPARKGNRVAPEEFSQSEGELDRASSLVIGRKGNRIAPVEFSQSEGELDRTASPVIGRKGTTTSPDKFSGSEGEFESEQSDVCTNGTSSSLQDMVCASTSSARLADRKRVLLDSSLCGGPLELFSQSESDEDCQPSTSRDTRFSGTTAKRSLTDSRVCLPILSDTKKHLENAIGRREMYIQYVAKAILKIVSCANTDQIRHTLFGLTGANNLSEMGNSIEDLLARKLDRLSLVKRSARPSFRYVVTRAEDFEAED